MPTAFKLDCQQLARRVKVQHHAYNFLLGSSLVEAGDGGRQLRQVGIRVFRLLYLTHCQ